MKESAFYKTALLIAVFFIHHTALPQADKLGSWNNINIGFKPTKQLSFFAEVEARSQLFTSNFFYREEKAGIGYNIPKKLSLLFAMSDCRTYSSTGNFKNLQIQEFRMWEQLILNSNLNRLRIEHRYRIEQRWINGEYRNRFRYRINPLIPLNGKTLVPHVLFASISDEVFFSDNIPYFEGNRFYAGAGYLFSRLLMLQAGFVRQYAYRKTDNGSGKNFIQTTLQFSIDKSNVHHTDKHPAIMN